MMEIIKPKTLCKIMWYYKNAARQYAEQIEKQLDGKVDLKLQAEVDKVKKAKEMEKWNRFDLRLQKALELQVKSRFY